MKGRPITDREAFPALWITAVALLLCYLLWRAVGRPTVSGCWIYSTYQVYCPGCGGTRALTALAHGHLLRSAYYNPAVPLAGVTVALYLTTQTLKRLRGCGRALHYSVRWPRTLAAVLLINCLVRNLLWLGFGIPI